tara:strand:- start:1603 stop:2673 length:1071 start_codon:yes stop_codon:yes gene_type:complete
MISRSSHSDFFTNENGVIVGCSHCTSPNIVKMGVAKLKKGNKQRYKCKECACVSLNLVLLTENRDFEIGSVRPEPEMTIEDIIKYRVKKFKVKTQSQEYYNLTQVNIKTHGVIGICHFGDPHVDDDGTNLSELFGICDVIKNTEGMFAGNLGDIQNNWVGRLQALYGQQSTTAKESWKLSEYFLNKLPWLYLVGGNHDVWSGDGDPIEFIMRKNTRTTYANHGVRLNLNFPNKTSVRVNARHTFKGNSMWNSAHGVSKAIQMGWRDHIVTAGHTHVSGYQVLKDPASGLISHALQVASFKRMDEYANRLGLDDKNIFNCPVTIIDPKYADDDNRKITTIFNPFEASEYLKWKRSQK